MSKLKSLIGTKKFYKTVIAIALPVMLQQGITSFVSILDNLMVGQLDTISFDAVAIVNQILFIINIALVGGLAGPGIYISQYLGANDEDGMRRSFRVKMLFALVILTVGILVYSIFGRQLIGSFFLNDPNATLKVEKGLEYLFYMISMSIKVFYGNF
jgi:Na+-driven multidrug efflux pump